MVDQLLIYSNAIVNHSQKETAQLSRSRSKCLVMYIGGTKTGTKKFGKIDERLDLIVKVWNKFRSQNIDSVNRFVPKGSF